MGLLRRKVRPDLEAITTRCLCGSHQWKVWVTFDEDTWEIATISTEMYCLDCGAKAVTPTPADKEAQS